MSLTRPIPTEAMPVVLEIRRLVPRPTKKPRVIKRYDTPVILWPNSLYGGGLCHHKYMYDCCPMGMLPSAHNSCPIDVDTLPRYECQEFSLWFGEQTDIEAVTDAIWIKGEGE